MPKRRKKRKLDDKADAPPIVGTASDVRQQYERACQVAQRGDHAAASRLYEQLDGLATDLSLRALIQNDLGTLGVLTGNLALARQHFRAALALDAQCKPARENLDVLDAQAEFCRGDEQQPRQSPSRKIKIAMVSFLFNWPSTGGGIVHTVELTSFLQKAGYEVRLFYAHFPRWGVGKVDRTVSFPSTAIEFDDATWSLASIKDRFRQAVAAFDPDYSIITDSWNMKPHLADAVRARSYLLRLQAMECLCPLNNVRLLHDDRGRFQQCPLHQLATPERCLRCLRDHGRFSGTLHRRERELSGVGTPEYDRLLRQTFWEAEAVLVVNPLHEAMLSPYCQRVRVVTAGMDPARFPWPRPEEPARSPEKVTFLFAGLLEEPMKGFGVLQDAAHQLWQRRQDFEVIATGDPAGAVNSHTRLVGWQSQEDLPKCQQAADVVVVPTIAQEALGRTAVEAMAAGRAVIASRLGGLPFTVAEGATGLLFEPGDPDDLAQKMEQLLDDPALRARMGLAGRKRFEERYSWNVIIDRHYRSLLRLPRERVPNQSEYLPIIPDTVDHAQIRQEASRFFGLPSADVEDWFLVYRNLHKMKNYAETLGERKTVCFEEAFLLYLALGLKRPRTIIEIGTHHGRSTRRIIDMATALGLKAQIVAFDITNEVVHFRPDEAEFITRDLTGRVAEEVLAAYEPGLLFLDVHRHALLKETIGAIVTNARPWLLAIHDCSPGLCNPRMSLSKDADSVTSSTGVWERHVLAEILGIGDPLSQQLDNHETARHQLRIFSTPHGLALLFPK
jgi:glycosyltransferase involved in cell wall biosynthesis